MQQRALTDDERCRYENDGYVVPQFRLSEALLSHLRNGVDALVRENPAVRPEHLVLRWGGGHAALPTHQIFLEFARDSSLLDLVEEVVGPDIICWGAHVICKPPGNGLQVPWHQDSGYWPIRPVATSTVWIALDPSTPENGCLRVIPGSHRSGVNYHHRIDGNPELAIEQVADDERFDDSTATDVVLDAGQLSIHDAFLLHSSRANRSPARRAGLALRFMPATSLYDRSIKKGGGGVAIRQDMSRRPIYLVRGQDRAGNDFETGRDQPFAVG